MEKTNQTEIFFKELNEIVKELAAGERKLDAIVDSLMLIEVDFTEFPVMKGLEDLDFYGMTPQEQAFLLFMIHNIFVNGLQPLDLGSLKTSIGDDLRTGKNALLERGLVRAVAADSDTAERSTTRRERTMLTPDTCGKLFYGMTDIISYERMARQVEVIKPVAIREKELFFEEENRGDVERLYTMLDPERFTSIMDRLRERGRRASVSCLFYGAPGTGKTELAKQLARATGRDIMMADVSKLHSSFTGDTEKNYRELFMGYSYIQRISPRAPILLFNEADGILGKRGDVMRQAIDKIANRVQNLLLQEMEDFEGIFIATTNLADNIDPAFERRLLFKMEFRKPGEETRARIWRAKLPDLPDGDIRRLASGHEFTGGQIDNIATKVDLDYIIGGSMPGIEDVEQYCSEERMGGRKEVRRIGFQTMRVECNRNDLTYSPR